jgi:DNA-binding transcriptional regulator YdaS (Cro superfamily)
VTQNGVRLAVLRAGGATALARVVGVTRQAVIYWIRVGHVPIARVDDVARATGVAPRDLVQAEVRKWI